MLGTNVEITITLQFSNSHDAALVNTYKTICQICKLNIMLVQRITASINPGLIMKTARKMKGGTKDFSYPLIDRCVEILKLRKLITGGIGFVFTGRKGEQMSSGAMLEAVKVICGVKGIKRTDPKYKPKYTDRQSSRRIVPHSIRSTIFSWAEDHGYKL